MQVKKTVLIPVADRTHESVDGRYHGAAIVQVNTVYKKSAGIGLLQHYFELVGSDTSDEHFQRTSEDNGKTWSEPSVVYKPEKTEAGVLRRGESTFFLDEERDAILLLYNYHLYPGNHFTGDVGKYTRIFMRISSNGGETFSEPQQIIQKGFDKKNWTEGVIHGENSIAISFCAPIKTSTNKILVPVCRTPLGSDFNLIIEEVGCFIGEWQGEQIEWDLSQIVKIDPLISSRGITEPALAELSSGDFLMICRCSNAGLENKPGYKRFCFSKDGGYNWSEPLVLKYDTGENFFSPATGSRLIRSSKNGKLYWIGNILKENPDGNRPRYPLQIAEVDEEKIALIKETVTIIEDKQKGDSPLVQFSNFKVYEDRETYEFVLTMARIQERGERDLTSPAYQYRIEV